MSNKAAGDGCLSCRFQVRDWTDYPCNSCFEKDTKWEPMAMANPDAPNKGTKHDDGKEIGRASCRERG